MCDVIGVFTACRVRVCVGGRSWVGEGATPQGARHDAAARALHELRPLSHADDTGTSPDHVRPYSLHLSRQKYFNYTDKQSVKYALFY